MIIRFSLIYLNYVENYEYDDIDDLEEKSIEEQMADKQEQLNDLQKEIEYSKKQLLQKT